MVKLYTKTIPVPERKDPVGRRRKKQLYFGPVVNPLEWFA